MQMKTAFYFVEKITAQVDESRLGLRLSFTQLIAINSTLLTQCIPNLDSVYHGLNPSNYCVVIV